MKSFLSWSTGKDAAYTLLKLLENNQKPDLLLTTVNKDFNRVSMHGVRNELLKQQAQAIGIDLHTIALSKDVSMENYNQIMKENLLKLKQQGFDTGIFGDIFLDDLRSFREQQMASIGFQTLFPIWKIDTHKLAHTIIDSGIKAIVVSVSNDKLGKDFVGREYDKTFLQDLPENIDWCGENGEFHSFVYDAPFFKSPIRFSIGEKTYKTYKPCSKSDQNTYKKNVANTNDKWDTGFWYIELAEKR